MPSLFLCEGVATYLERSVLESLLRQLREVASDDARLAISLSVSANSAAQLIRREAFQSAVAAMGEPARTVLTNDEADEGSSRRTRWRITEPAGALVEQTQRARYAGLLILEPRSARSPAQILSWRWSSGDQSHDKNRGERRRSRCFGVTPPGPIKRLR